MPTTNVTKEDVLRFMSSVDSERAPRVGARMALRLLPLIKRWDTTGKHSGAVEDFLHGIITGRVTEQTRGHACFEAYDAARRDGSSLEGSKKRSQFDEEVAMAASEAATTANICFRLSKDTLDSAMGAIQIAGNAVYEQERDKGNFDFSLHAWRCRMEGLFLEAVAADCQADEPLRHPGNLWPEGPPNLLHP